MKFDAVTDLIPDRPAEAQKLLENAIDGARQSINEGRDALQGLRSPNVISDDLARAISTLGEGMAAEQTSRNSSAFHVIVKGTPRSLPPLVRTEVYRIAGEALRNAFRHAQAGRIEVDIHYDKRRFRLRVRDDGKGIVPEFLGEGGRPGHHGLPGLHERANLVGGKLAIWSELDSGTEIELSIPGSVAFAPPSDASDAAGTASGAD